MGDSILYLPLATTGLAALFAWQVFRRWRTRTASVHLAWYAAGFALYGAGTLTEGLTAVLGWHELLFRTWYITGALLGGAPLAQGTVYLLFPRRIANALTVPLLTVVAVAAVFVLLTPLDTVDKGTKLLETSIIQWTWVRAFSPFINTYAFIFLVGGAAYSAIHFRHSNPRRAAGTAAIAFGAILPGIGGALTRAGHTEALYITEFIGILLIFGGYLLTLPQGSQPATEPSGSALPGTS